MAIMKSKQMKKMKRRSKRLQDKKISASSSSSIPGDMIRGLNESEKELVVSTLCSDPYDHPIMDSRDQTIQLQGEICQRLREARQCIQDVEVMEDRDSLYSCQNIRKTRNKKKDITKKQKLNKNTYAQLCGVFKKCFKQFRVPKQKYESLKNETKEDLLQTLNKSPLKDTIIKIYKQKKLKKYIQLRQADRSQKIYNMQVCRRIIASVIIGKQIQKKVQQPLLG